MPDLSGIGRNALEMQQRHEGFETWVGRYCAVGFEAHRLISRARSLASGGVRLSELRLLAQRRLGDGRRTLTRSRRDEARRHELAEHARACRCRRRQGWRRAWDNDVISRTAIEDILRAAAEQNVIARAAAEDLAAVPADQDIVAVAAIGREQDAV